MSPIEEQKVAFLFPGQGSQTVGMGAELAQQYPAARQVFEEADEVLGLPLSRIAWEGPAEELGDTINTQPALLVHSVAALRVLEQVMPGLKPALLAGHSMGQITALVAGQALNFPSALQLARLRGQYMKEAGDRTPGGMAAIIGLEIDLVDQICHQASRAAEIVQVANDNCPGQCVISGEAAALARAEPLARAAGARRVIRLDVSIPAHSPMMGHAQQYFTAAVNGAGLKDPRMPIVGNVSASPLSTAGDLHADLVAQLTSRVRWTESMRQMQAQGIQHFFEIGTGNVLSGLLRRVDRSLNGVPLGTPGNFDALLN